MTRSSTFRALSGAAALVLGLVACGVGTAVWLDRDREIQSGIRAARNVAVVIAGHLSRSIQAVDIVLRDLEAQIEAEVAETPEAPPIRDREGFRAVMLQRLGFLPEAFNIAVADEHGRVIVSTAGWPTPVIDVADREYFVDLAAHDDGRLATPLPLRNRVNNASTIVLARRIDGPERRFRGVVLISLGTRYFEQVYKPVEGLANQSFALVRRDGVTFVRYPDPIDRAGIKLPADSPWYTVAAQGGSYRSPGVFAAVARWVAVEPVPFYPFVVHIAVPESVLLARWRFQAAAIAVGTVILLVVALALLVLMVRQYRLLSASGAALSDQSSALMKEHNELVAHQAALEVQNQRFDAAINHMIQGLAMFDGRSRLVVCNERFRDIYGFQPALTIPGTPIRDLVAELKDLRGDPARIDAFTRDILTGVESGQARTFEFSPADGRIVHVFNRPMAGGGWMSTHEDITERRQVEERIRRLAHSDLLTGVANRSHFVEEIAAACRRLAEEGRPFSVLMLDLDRFKAVNDTLGHAAGDQLLKELARRLERMLRADDVLARLGGDEFAVIQSPPRDFVPDSEAGELMRESAIVLASRIVDVVDQPFDIDGHKVAVGASIGLATAPEHGVVADELMKKADLALYAIKGNGRNGFAFFDPAMAAEAHERERLEIDFRAGLLRGEFELYYQPLVDARSGRLRGVEALVRWNHPAYGLVKPDRFIALAEDTGLVGQLGEWILQTACNAAAGWPDDVKVAVNVSPVQFRKTNLLDVIMCALVDSGLAPERLEIEITERVLLDWEKDHVSVLHQLKNLGVSVALDDFGTGYSSLSYLTAFPFDKLKIDRCFTRDLLAREGCGAIVCAIVNLGRSLDMVTVAEGVETETQLQLLRAAGVDQVQGYLIGPPTPAAELAFERDGPAVPAVSA